MDQQLDYVPEVTEPRKHFKPTRFSKALAAMLAVDLAVSFISGENSETANIWAHQLQTDDGLSTVYNGCEGYVDTEFIDNTAPVFLPDGSRIDFDAGKSQQSRDAIVAKGYRDEDSKSAKPSDVPNIDADDMSQLLYRFMRAKPIQVFTLPTTGQTVEVISDTDDAKLHVDPELLDQASFILHQPENINLVPHSTVRNNKRCFIDRAHAGEFKSKRIRLFIAEDYGDCFGDLEMATVGECSTKAFSLPEVRFSVLGKTVVDFLPVAFAPGATSEFRANVTIRNLASHEIGTHLEMNVTRTKYNRDTGENIARLSAETVEAHDLLDAETDPIVTWGI